MCGFIAQLVEQRTGNAEVMGSNPVEARIFFRLLLSNCLNWKIYCNDHSSLSSTTTVQKLIISYTSHHFTPHGRYQLNKLTSLPMCGFIAQLVEQRTCNAKAMGSNPVEAQIFFRLLLSNCLNWKIYCDDRSSLSSTTAVQKLIISYTSHQKGLCFTISLDPFALNIQLQNSNINRMELSQTNNVLKIL